MWTLISDGLLCSLGFKRARIWDKRQENFTFKYSIEGFDGQIDLIATFCAPATWPPEKQVNDGASIEFLKEHCSGFTYHVYGGNFHIVSINLEAELLILLSVLKIEINY